MKLYNSQLEVSLKISNLPFNVTEDVGKYETLKRNILSLNYEIVSNKKTINIKPVINVTMDELSHPFFPMLVSMVQNTHNMQVIINPILIAEFGLDINKIITSIENIVNTTLDIEDKEKPKAEEYTIQSLENKLKRYNALLNKHSGNKIQTNKIANKIIDLSTKLEKLKKHEKFNFPDSNNDSV